MNSWSKTKSLTFRNSIIDTMDSVKDQIKMSKGKALVLKSSIKENKGPSYMNWSN